ncbi:MAG: 5'-3' exonuclease [Solirubrobacterales bacterium]
MILAIDGTNWTHVLYHAIRSGDPVEKFLGRIDRLRERWPQLDLVVVGFDLPPSFRKGLYAEYKATRGPSDRELVELLQNMQAACRDRGDVITICEPGFEADDVLATTARLAVESGRKCVLASPDKDLAQCLLDGWVTMMKGYRVAGRDLVLDFVTSDSLFEKFGVRPDQWTDYQCLVGDSGDNIPGVPGIGPKIAAEVLQRCGSLDAALANPWRSGLSDKLRNKLVAFKPNVELTRKLVTLEHSVPLVVDALDLEPVQSGGDA